MDEGADLIYPRSSHGPCRLVPQSLVLYDTYIPITNMKRGWPVQGMKFTHLLAQDPVRITARSASCHGRCKPGVMQVS
jgi:hypothetical protein